MEMDWWDDNSAIVLADKNVACFESGVSRLTLPCTFSSKIFGYMLLEVKNLLYCWHASC